jgi:hypothetical protein
VKSLEIELLIGYASDVCQVWEERKKEKGRDNTDKDAENVAENAEHIENAEHTQSAVEMGDPH